MRDKLKLVGPLKKTMHKVQGTVYILNESTLVIENFVYDGKGFAVHINVGKFAGDGAGTLLASSWA
jgi:hypothetical protein